MQRDQYETRGFSKSLRMCIYICFLMVQENSDDEAFSDEAVETNKFLVAPFIQLALLFPIITTIVETIDFSRKISVISSIVCIVGMLMTTVATSVAVITVKVLRTGPMNLYLPLIVFTITVLDFVLVGLLNSPHLIALVFVSSFIIFQSRPVFSIVSAITGAALVIPTFQFVSTTWNVIGSVLVLLCMTVIICISLTILIRQMTLTKKKNDILNHRASIAISSYASRALLVNVLPEKLLNEMVIRRNTEISSQAVSVDITINGLSDIDVVKQGAVVAIIVGGLDHIAGHYRLNRTGLYQHTATYSCGMYTTSPLYELSIQTLCFTRDAMDFIALFAGRVQRSVNVEDISPHCAIATGPVSLITTGGKIVFMTMGSLYPEARRLATKATKGTIVASPTFVRALPSSSPPQFARQIVTEPVHDAHGTIGYIINNTDFIEGFGVAHLIIQRIKRQAATWHSVGMGSDPSDGTTIDRIAVELLSLDDPDLALPATPIDVQLDPIKKKTNMTQFRFCQRSVGIVDKILLDPERTSKVEELEKTGIEDTPRDMNGESMDERPRLKPCSMCESRGLCDYHTPESRAKKRTARPALRTIAVSAGEANTSAWRVTAIHVKAKAAALSVKINTIGRWFYPEDPILRCYNIYTFPKTMMIAALAHHTTIHTAALVLLLLSVAATAALLTLPTLFLSSVTFEWICCLTKAAFIAILTVSSLIVIAISIIGIIGLYSVESARRYRSVRRLLVQPIIQILVWPVLHLQVSIYSIAGPAFSLFMVVLAVVGTVLTMTDLADFSLVLKGLEIPLLLFTLILSVTGSPLSVMCWFAALVVTVPVDVLLTVTSGFHMGSSVVLVAAPFLLLVQFESFWLRRYNHQAVIIGRLQKAYQHNIETVQHKLLVHLIPDRMLPAVLRSIRLVQFRGAPKRLNDAVDVTKPSMLDDARVRIMMRTLVPYCEVYLSAAVIVVTITPPRLTPAVVERLGALGTEIAMVRKIVQVVNEVARRYRVSIIGTHHDRIILAAHQDDDRRLAMDRLEQMSMHSGGSTDMSTLEAQLDEAAADTGNAGDGLDLGGGVDRDLIDLVDNCMPKQVAPEAFADYISGAGSDVAGTEGLDRLRRSISVDEDAAATYPMVTAVACTWHLLRAVRTVFRPAWLAKTDLPVKLGVATGPLLSIASGSQSVTLHHMGRGLGVATFLSANAGHGSALLSQAANQQLLDEFDASGMDRRTFMTMKGETIYGGQLGWLNAQLLR